MTTASENLSRDIDFGIANSSRNTQHAIRFAFHVPGCFHASSRYSSATE